jgi:hypothetical protein
MRIETGLCTIFINGAEDRVLLYAETTSPIPEEGVEQKVMFTFRNTKRDQAILLYL